MLDIVDMHHHFYPPDYRDAWLTWDRERGIPHLPLQAEWTPELAVAELDERGIAAAVLTLASTPGLWFDLDHADATHMTRHVNEFGREMARNFPGRFAFMATLPMIDIQASLDELSYALDTLGADGVGLQTSYGDRWPGDPAFSPIFEELNRRGSVVHFHPLAPTCCQGLDYGTFAGVAEFPHDTTRAILSLLLSGTFARYRNIRWVFSHAGGTLTSISGRIEYFVNQRPDVNEIAPSGVAHELSRLFFDTANALYPPTMSALLSMTNAEQALFGSDYPYVPILPQLQALEASPLSGDEMAGVAGGNARRLFRRLQSADGATGLAGEAEA